MALPTSEEERSPDVARNRLGILVHAAADEFLKLALENPSKVEVEGILLRNKCEDAVRAFIDQTQTL